MKEKPSTDCVVTRWEGCYELQWSGLIVPAAFCHPAKFARGLIERIYEHCLARGYLQRGDLVGDPFGGIGSGGIAAAYRGLRWVGGELEPKFVALAEENFAWHRSRLERLGAPRPRMVQGDSRKFDEMIQGLSAVVTSPPYADSISSGQSGIDWSKGQGGRDFTKEARHDGLRKPMGLEYGAQPGQIGALKAGLLDGAITSPPYANVAAGAGGLNSRPARKAGQQCGRRAASASQGADQRYGGSEGQISKLRSGALEGVVTSPPWQNNCEGSRKASRFGGPEKLLNVKRGHGASDAAILAQAKRDEEKVYGTSPGQIGALKAAGPETYWTAMRAVYESCARAIKPGGVMVVVVKDYVARKQRVCLCDDTARLLEHVGFTIVERVQAMLVSETVHEDFFAQGGNTIERTERKSFFRRLHERNGGPRIDYEEVIIARCTKGQTNSNGAGNAAGRCLGKFQGISLK